MMLGMGGTLYLKKYNSDRYRFLKMNSYKWLESYLAASDW